MSNTIFVGSYNMSFASDLGKVLGSEGNFLSPREPNEKPIKPGTTITRNYWKNALGFLTKFFETHIDSVVGLQEINIPSILQTDNEVHIYEKDQIQRSSEELTGLDAIRDSLDDNICVCVGGVRSGPAFPSLVIAYHKKFGNVTNKSIQELNLQMPTADGKKPQLGRPILIIETDQNFLFITLHAPNDGTIFAKTNGLQLNLVSKLNELISDKYNHIERDKIFIMGDFNDPYNVLKKIMLNNNNLIYNGTAPKSCCYNINSSGHGDTKQIIDTIKDTDNTIISTFEFIKERRHPDNKTRGGPPTFFLNEEYHTMGDEGKIRNYGFYGDYVFGLKPVSDLTTFRPVSEPISEESKESDHEMVFASYNYEKNNTLPTTSSPPSMTDTFKAEGAAAVRADAVREEAVRARREAREGPPIPSTREAAMRARRAAMRARRAAKAEAEGRDVRLPGPGILPAPVIPLEYLTDAEKVAAIEEAASATATRFGAYSKWGGRAKAKLGFSKPKHTQKAERGGKKRKSKKVRKPKKVRKSKRRRPTKRRRHSIKRR